MVGWTLGLMLAGFLYMAGKLGEVLTALKQTQDMVKHTQYLISCLPQPAERDEPWPDSDDIP